jgi:hypothetical protein
VLRLVTLECVLPGKYSSSEPGFGEPSGGGLWVSQCWWMVVCNVLWLLAVSGLACIVVGCSGFAHSR